jgi:light-regulated signal transduction histidine kinase (bacteriophytochrome)
MAGVTMLTADPLVFGNADLTNCDLEPIHIPGSIQPHGVLLVVDRQDLSIEQSAGNTKLLLGVDPEGLIGLLLPALLDRDTLAFAVAHLVAPLVHIAPVVRLGVVLRSSAIAQDLTLSADGRTVLLEFEPARRAASTAGDPIAQLKTLLSSLADTATVEECCKAAAVALRTATAFDRAMVYRFEPDETGVVIAEDLEPGMEPYLGLHYPASDVPQQAREMYKRNWLRAIPDVHYLPASLRPPQNPRSGGPIDMSNCGLRSVSPIHLEYLRNMGTAATLVTSVICNGRLWGLLVLHHQTPHYVASDMRVACETFAQVFSLQIEAKALLDLSTKRIAARGIREAVVSRLSGSADIAQELASRDLLEYVDATGIAVFVSGRLCTAGFVPAAADLTLLMQWLDRVNRPAFSTDCLQEEYPAAAAYADRVSGLLAVSIARNSRDYVLWFRAEYETTVRWAGDPTKPVVVGDHGWRLTPRGSFAEWLGLKRMHSVPWSEVELEAADALRINLLENALKAADRSLLDRERAYQRLNLLLSELDHRVRTALGKIEVMVTEAGKTTVSMHSFTTALRHRIQAMTQAHTLLAEGKWVGTSLRTLIEEDVAPATPGQKKRIFISGDDLFLSPLETLALSMVLHELLTNALKHGALSAEQGRVAVDWDMDIAKDGLRIHWRETGGPKLQPAVTSGTGIDLITQTIEHDLRGRVDFAFAPEGLNCTLRLPVGDPSLR